MNSEYLLGLETATWSNAQVSVELLRFFVVSLLRGNIILVFKTYKSEIYKFVIKGVN